MLLMALALAATSSSPLSGKVTLACAQSVTQRYPLTRRDFYLHPPASVKQFAKDAWDYGLVGLTLAPGKTWTIDFDAGTVTEVGTGFRAMEIEEVTPQFVVADGRTETSVRRIHINRATGETTLFISSNVTAWNARFKAKLLPFRVWDLECKPDGPLF